MVPQHPSGVVHLGIAKFVVPGMSWMAVSARINKFRGGAQVKQVAHLLRRIAPLRVALALNQDGQLAIDVALGEAQGVCLQLTPPPS